MIFDITSIVTEASLDCFVSGTYTEQKINDKREYTENVFPMNMLIFFKNHQNNYFLRSIYFKEISLSLYFEIIFNDKMEILLFYIYHNYLLRHYKQ